MERQVVPAAVEHVSVPTVSFQAADAEMRNLHGFLLGYQTADAALYHAAASIPEQKTPAAAAESMGWLS